jgi:intracellular sulfur oxidation DsrE/DsrF family protein
MAKKTLAIIESAYRATLEEQDDTAVWITHAMKGAGGEFTVLLRGNAVNYGVNGQEASGVAFGSWKQTQPPKVSQDVAGLIGKGIEVYVVEEDLADRGIERTDLVANIKTTNRAGIAKLFTDHERVWHW